MSTVTEPLTLFEKLWRSHVVDETDEGLTLLYVDRQLVYEVTSPQAFEGLRLAGRQPRRPDTVLATADHNVPTTRAERTPGGAGISDVLSRLQVAQLTTNCDDFGITEYRLDDPRQGIIHIIGPEQGATLPGMTVVAGDSHTSTHGAFAALAFGVGTSEVEHVLATQCLSVSRMKSMSVTVEGSLRAGVSAKDLVLHIIRLLGASGGAGHAIEFRGSTIRDLSMEARMTLCNMAIECGARVGLVAVDETTIDYLHGRPMAPAGALWEQATAYWRTLRSDDDASFDTTVTIDAADVKPMVTWGTSPDMAVDIDGCVPDPAAQQDAAKRADMERALFYMGLQPGQKLADIRPDRIFIGSCTNARIEDLRLAAAVVNGHRVAASVTQALVVPG
ncbi:3-isopropylmalate dehydratase large subunit [soil metagenome]